MEHIEEPVIFFVTVFLVAATINWVIRASISPVLNPSYIGTAIGIEEDFKSEDMDRVIGFCHEQPAGCGIVLQESIIFATSSPIKTVKELVPQGGRFQTEMRFVIDGKNYDMSWEDFKQRIEK